ncbi:hypothetical protein OsI_00745 [Oryza sativa Indica Group]|uniref:Uncharacterized protein n=1 Tax=Oryza sativa subsp. indica TaxID=39946 RepID=B8ADQ3_ORYSI|nr:hypothetical protein OsI_00745 [Oryza sativa Indica Group]
MVGSKRASGEEDGGRDGKLELTDSNPLSLASVFSPAVSSPYSPSPCSRLQEEGVLRTEINPSLDKVTVVGDVDSRVLVKKLSKVGKITEVMAPPPPPSPAAPSEEGKKSDSNGGEKPTSPADEKSTRKDEGKDGKGDKSPAAAAAAAAACKQECSKCTAGKEAATRADEAGRAAGKTASSKDATTKRSGDGDKSEPAAVVVEYQYHHHYNRLEPAMVIRHKHLQVRELLVNFGKFDPRKMESSEPDAILKPIVPCDEIFRYRNKMEFSFGTKRWMQREWKEEKDVEVVKEEKVEGDGYSLGLHAPGFFDKVLHVEKCLLQSEPADKVLAIVQETWLDPALGLTPYDVHKHVGFLKHLMIRTGRNITTGAPEVMVNFVTSCYKPELLEPLVNNITKIPEVVSIMNNVNTSVGNTSVGEEEYTLYGKPTITEMLRGLTFQISANSFFQTNTKQADVLYKLIGESAGLKGDGSEIILDLFCGTGTIGLTLARRAKHVYGYEVVPEAIADAKKNAKLNGISNATFVQGDLNKINETFGKEFPKPDIIISDPNRPGMHMKLIKWLLEVKAPRIVYVSCNPATCARDLDYLCHGVEEKDLKGCYELKTVIPVDMFPHTPHIECICVLELC